MSIENLTTLSLTNQIFSQIKLLKHFFDYPQEVRDLWKLPVRYYDFYSFIAYCATPNAAVL